MQLQISYIHSNILYIECMKKQILFVSYVAIKGKCHPSLSENVTDHKPSRYNLLYLGIKEVI